jgi:hypothetical protein
MNEELFIGHIGFSVQSWLNYISAVGREYVLSEGSIKLPLAEFISARIADTSSVSLEFPHPSFVKRRMDLHYTKLTPNRVEVGFEFKYVKNGSTLPTAERQRVFNDLMRLNYFIKQSSITAKGYFLICGMQYEFLQSFQKIVDTNTATFPGPTVPLGTPVPPVLWSGFYTEWFSFDKTNLVTRINLQTTNQTYLDIYNEFISEYSVPYLIKTGSPLVLPSAIQTTLVFLSSDNEETNIPNPMKLGIWEVTVI